jgi:hypothetical protein
MRITFKAELVDNGFVDEHGGITLEFRDLQPALLDVQPRIMTQDAIGYRPLTQQETDDLENCLQEFHNLQVAKALAKYIVI